MKIIDWELGLKLAGNKRDLAEELLSMLTTHLVDEMKHIEEAFSSKNVELLYQRIHKLHGAVSYCGTPRLKETIFNLEKCLKQNDFEKLQTLLEKFKLECQFLLDACLKEKISF